MGTTICSRLYSPPFQSFFSLFRTTRLRGLNYVCIPTVLRRGYRDLIDCYGCHIDWMKFSGHQFTFTNLKLIHDAIRVCYNADIKIAVGTSPIDATVRSGDQIFYMAVKNLSKIGIDLFEISCLARSIDDEDLCRMISLAREHKIGVITEIGVAFAHMTPGDDELFLNRRIDQAKVALEAEASIVLIE